jgi:hypothetical protein
MLAISDYSALSLRIIETAEIPVRASPLKGTTLATLGGGSYTILELFHSGVSLQEASTAVVFVAGAMIVFGVADAVGRALAAGVEDKLLKIFGLGKERTVGALRNISTKAKRRG